MNHYSPGDEVVYDGMTWIVDSYTDEDGEQWIEHGSGLRVIAHVDDLSYVDPLEWENNRAN